LSFNIEHFDIFELFVSITETKSSKISKHSMLNIRQTSYQPDLESGSNMRTVEVWEFKGVRDVLETFNS